MGHLIPIGDLPRRVHDSIQREEISALPQRKRSADAGDPLFFFRKSAGFPQNLELKGRNSCVVVNEFDSPLPKY